MGTVDDLEVVFRDPFGSALLDGTTPSLETELAVALLDGGFFAPEGTQGNGMRLLKLSFSKH